MVFEIASSLVLIHLFSQPLFLVVNCVTIGGLYAIIPYVLIIMHHGELSLPARGTPIPHYTLENHKP